MGTSMGSGEHFMCTDIEWDPTGRYVATGVSYWAHKADNAYWLWNFQGKILKRSNVEKFCQLVWRPRPARNWLTSDVHWLMPSMTGDGMLAAYEEKREERLALRGGVDTDKPEGDGFDEETVGFLVKEEETILQE